MTLCAEETRVRRDRRSTTTLLLCGLLAAAGLVTAAESDLPAALERASTAAETSLRQGDLRAAEARYREALFDGWLLVGSLERLEKRVPEARAAIRRASFFATEDRPSSHALARAYLQAEEPQEAVDVLAALAKREPRDIETRRLLSAALSAAGRPEQAKAVLDEASAIPTDDPEQAFLIGSQYLWQRDVEAAARLFAKVVAARPIPQTHVLIGRSYRDAAEYGRARTELETALRLDPSVRRAHYYLGMIALNEDMSADRVARAEAEFRQELKLAADDPLTNDQLGQLLLDAGRAREALPALEAAVRADARSAYLSHLGRCQLALEQPAEAVVTLRRALELAGQQADEEELESIHFQLGRALRSIGPEAEARQHLAEAARLAASRRDAAAARGPGASQAARGVPLLEDSALAGITPEQRKLLRGHVDAILARAYFNLGVIQAQDLQVPAMERYARAASSFEKAAEIDPAFPQVQASLGIARFNARQFGEAVAPLTRALAKTPTDDSLKRMLATARLDTGAWAEAVALLDADPVLANDPDPSLQFGRGLALLRSGRAEDAERVLAALLLRGGESAEALVLLGQARVQLGHYEPAVAALERALRLKPDVADADASLGLARWKLGRAEQAESALRAALARRPSDLGSQLTLAELLEATKRADEAVPLLRDVVAANPDSGEAHLMLGGILLARGEDAEALAQLEAAARQLPEEPGIQEQLAQAYRKLGRKAEAERALEAARRLQKKRGEGR
jgi:tetratricopeptide (TPR) repeat protein